MKENKIFLEGYNSKSAVNTDSELNVPLRGNRKLLPLNDLAEVISSFDVYNDERRACNKIRLTCQVNPVCSNVLFNRITEIVKDEGSSAVTFVNYGITGKSDVFDNEQVVYKNNTINFWSGNTMSYQTIDNTLVGTGPHTKVSELGAHIASQPAVGSSDLENTTGTTPWHPTNAIRDTQLSRNDKKHNHFVYHCGLDILNNHLIRSNTFKCVCKMLEDSYDYNANNAYQAFNTIADYMRDVRGYRVIEKLYYPNTAGVNGHTKFLTLHTYLYDDILTFENSIKERLVSTYNGWLGFYNKSKIKSYENFNESDGLYIERPIMYLNGGDFVDMYPGRDLYSFVPKFNHFRQRIEKNWNYCITYPSSSTTEGFDDIFEFDKSLKAIYYDETRRNDNGTQMLVIYSKAKHGLSQGDYVNIYRLSADTEDHPINVKILDNAEVENVVDDFIFTVYTQDVTISRNWVQLEGNEVVEGGVTYIELNGVRYIKDKSLKFFRRNDPADTRRYYVVNNEYVNFDDDALHISYKKVVNDIECDYYVRIFSRLPNFKYSSGDTSNEYEIYRQRSDEDTRNLIQIYQQPEYDFESHVSRLAFAKNIYTDEVGEIVFTDDIELSYLKDNLGRPLSELFVTIVKNNKGYKEWYGYDRDIDINSSAVEYSHCFGRITCGLEMSDQCTCEPGNNNIKKINLVEGTDFGYDIEAINGTRSYRDGSLEVPIRSEEIWFDSDINYYGDLCYYDNYNAIERVIQPILHRVNTAQRESIISKTGSDRFAEFLYDDIEYDDYDTGNIFKIKNDTFMNCNNKKEGYYYIPHYQIPIRSFDKLRTIMPDFLSIMSLVNNNDNTTTITTLEKHFLSPGDKSMIYDKVTNKYYYCTTVRGTRDNPKVYTCTIADEDGNPATDIDGDKLYDEDDVVRYKLFKIDNLDVPSYARVLKDGTCRFIWRDILNNGFNTSDKTLEEYPFTNGAFYINRRIDLYLRRQDPNDWYNLYAEDDIPGIEPPIEDENNYIKEEEIEC